jgi:Flp pilus assembly protein TadG
MLVLFGLSLVALLLMVGLVVDGGYSFGQRRAAQNAADFAALAGTRIISENLLGNANGTPGNVNGAITSVLAANHAQLVSARYVNAAGADMGDVTTGTSLTGVNGVVVTANLRWRPFFLGIIGVNSWSAAAAGTAITPGSSVGGKVLPVGMQNTEYATLFSTACHIDQLSTCTTGKPLTSGSLYIPGGFGWLKFGCSGYGLGQGSLGGCANSRPFLQSEIGPPANSYGCCTAVTGVAGSDKIGSAPGNKPADLSYYIQNKIPVWVPVWDTASLGGSNGYYHIVGFAAIVFAGEDTQHGKWLAGAAVADQNGNAICSGTGNSIVPGTKYCTQPGTPFVTGATGEVRLLH